MSPFKLAVFGRLFVVAAFLYIYGRSGGRYPLFYYYFIISLFYLFFISHHQLIIRPYDISTGSIACILSF